MPVTNYHSVNGRILGETTAGVRTDYLTDALGSVTATVNASGAVVNRYRYKPYGALLSKSGAGADPKQQWVGTLGYRQTGKKYSDVYVRARHYDTANGRWTTKDPAEVVPPRGSYLYVHNHPSQATDWSGYQGGVQFSPIHIDPASCGAPGCKSRMQDINDEDVNGCIVSFCKALFDTAAFTAKIKPCLDEFKKSAGFEIDLKCLIGLCLSGQTIKCLANPLTIGMYTVCPDEIEQCPDNKCVSYKEAAYCAQTYSGGIGLPLQVYLCCRIGNTYVHEQCPGLGKDKEVQYNCNRVNATVFHELAHVCTKNKDVPNDDGTHKAQTAFANCVVKKIGCKEPRVGE